MPRVTATEVKEIISTNLTDVQTAPFILAANQLVTNLLGNKTILSEDNKKEIERWLSAHYISLYEKREAGRGIIGFGGIGGSSGKSPTVGFGLGSTSYGQTVVELDISGTLSNLGKSKASVTVIQSPNING